MPILIISGVILWIAGESNALPPCPTDTDSRRIIVLAPIPMLMGELTSFISGDDKWNGRGTFIYADGRLKAGIWDKGNLKNTQNATPSEFKDFFS